MKAFVEAHRAGRPSARHEIGAGLVFARSGKDGALVVQQAAGGVAVLHVSADVLGAQVRAPDADTAPFLYEGRESRSATVSWGGEVYFEGTRLAFSRELTTSRRSRVAIVATLLCAAGLAVQFLLTVAPETARAGHVEPPPLFSDGVLCPVGAETASRRAAHTFAAARAKEERSPFARADGVAAGNLYGEARACFAAAGDAEGEIASRAHFERWTTRMNEEYRAAHLALSLALENREFREALRLTRELLAFLEQRRDGPYVEWLLSVQRDLERKGRER